MESLYRQRQDARVVRDQNPARSFSAVLMGIAKPMPAVVLLARKLRSRCQ